MKNDKVITIKGLKIHIKSVFNGKIPLDKAISNIVKRKLSENENNQTKSPRQH